jgi:hypothetical protein
MPPDLSGPLVECRGLWVVILAIVVMAALVYAINKLPHE